jgi:hypothetical protein
MVYRATRKPTGGDPIIEHTIVDDEQQERQARTRGFVRGPDNAIKALEAQELEFATLAAEREHEKKHLSQRAVAEVERTEDQTIEHLPVIPETPIRRGPGRPRKDDTL